MLVESIIRSAAPPLESPGGADRDADADTLGEVAPFTLPRPAAPDTSNVRRDLEEELTAVAAESRPPRARQHDARPGVAEASAIARESFPEVYTSMPFLMTSNDNARQAQATEERADRWRILSRPSRPRSEEGPRRLYDLDVDGDGREVRESNNFDPATLGDVRRDMKSRASWVTARRPTFSPPVGSPSRRRPARCGNPPRAQLWSSQRTTSENSRAC
jgi:hypothetical protein